MLQVFSFKHELHEFSLIDCASLRICGVQFLTEIIRANLWNWKVEHELREFSLIDCASLRICGGRFLTEIIRANLWNWKVKHELHKFSLIDCAKSANLQWAILNRNHSCEFVKLES